MERSARVILVVTFLVVLGVPLALFLRWLEAPERHEVFSEPVIQFNGSVSGLSIGSDVRYLGVPVGRVTRIELNNTKAGRVDVTTSMHKPLPPVDRLVATLEPQGITGISVIELRDRSQDTPMFDTPEGVIPGYPSLLSQLAGAAPQIAQSAASALGKMDELLSNQAVAEFETTLAHLNRLSANLAAASEDIGELLATASRASRGIEETLPELSEAAQKLNRQVLPVMTGAGRSLTLTSDQVTALLDDNRVGLNRMVNEYLPTLMGSLDRLTATLQAVDELVSNINDEPGALLYGKPVMEVEIEHD